MQLKPLLVCSECGRFYFGPKRGWEIPSTKDILAIPDGKKKKYELCSLHKEANNKKEKSP